MKLGNLQYILEKLEKEEIAFLILFSYNNYKSKNYPLSDDLLKIIQTEGDDYIIPEAEVDEEFNEELEVFLEIEDNSEFSVFIRGSIIGYVKSGHPGSYDSPPENGEIELQEIYIHRIELSTGSDAYKKIHTDIDTISYAEIKREAEICLLRDRIECDTYSNSLKAIMRNHEIPIKFQNKIQKLLEENEKLISNKALSKKFNI